MYKLFLSIFLITSIILIMLIMLQKNNNVNFGSNFSRDTFGMLFSSNNSNNSMRRIISILVTFFFISSLALGNINSKKNKEINAQKNSTESKSITKQIQSLQSMQTNSINDIPK